MAGTAGRARQDKFYHLAKEIGFRSRASFKLVQLNKKYGFLDKSKVCLDLCAAPGGWMQVAQRTMDQPAIIVGVDQDPIKPLDRCIGLQEDLMSERCLKSIAKALKSWKADVVLCDGAPHYKNDFKTETIIQNKLVIRSLEIATKNLQKDGWFITKIARTKHFDSLISSMAQLFKKVYVTKPEASRKESSESYAICRGYLAPRRVDKNLIDIDTVLKDAQDAPVLKSVNDIFKINQKKVSHKLAHIPVKCKMVDFLRCDNYLDVLAGSYEITFGDDAEVEQNIDVPQSIRDHCKDLKIADKKAIRALLKWRTEARKSISKHSNVSTAERVDDDEDGDGGVNPAGDPQKPNSAMGSVCAQDLMAEEAKKRRKVEKKLRRREAKMKQFSTAAENETEALFNVEDHGRMLRGQEIDMIEDDFEDHTGHNIPEVFPNRDSKATAAPNAWIQNLIDENEIDMDRADELSCEEDDGDQDYNSRENKAHSLAAKNDSKKKAKKQLSEGVQSLTAEELAIAKAMVTSRKRKRDILEGSVNRYMTFQDPEGLPKWFVDEEREAYRPCELSGVDREEIEDQQRALNKQGRVNSRSLGKLAEVKARRKRKLDAKLAKANTAAQSIIDNEFTPTNMKIKKMRDLYRNILKKKERKYIVSKKKHKGKAPKNVKGPFKLVDRRMKKDKPRGKKQK